MQSALSVPPMDYVRNDTCSPVDISTVVIDTALPLNERMQSYLRQIKNPYRYKSGNIIVRISFADTDITLEDRIKHILLAPHTS